MAALLWFIAAMLLAAGELIGAELFLLMLAGGALGAAGTALIAPEMIWLSFVVFAVVSLLLVLLVRPTLKRRLLAKITPANVLVDRVVGATARTLTAVSELHGQAKVNGEIWSARVHDDQPTIPPATEVRVTEVRGATVFVERE
ncbi:NfeD family protein [Dermacoccaceae bacterium W4C1]